MRSVQIITGFMLCTLLDWKEDGVLVVRNRMEIPVAAIEPGTYQGKLLIHEGNKIRVRKCRIKALDKELDEK